MEFPDIPGYRILKQIAKGGMARIYLAYDEKIEREVALKVLLRKLTEDEEVTKRFIREAKTAARLQHTNIVSIYDVGQVEDYYYFTMEHLQCSLKEKALQPLDALKSIKQIAGALVYAHNEGFIHRDIKPENILFREDGTPVLVDFGIVRAVDSTTKLTKTGVAIGTPFYMSPEQISGMDLDQRADIYSLGVVLFEILTGEVPYKGTDVISISMKHLNEPIPKLPGDLSRYQPLVDSMMAKDREERIRYAEELITFIEAYIQGDEEEYIRNRNVALEGKVRKKRTSTIPRVVAVILFVIISISVYYLYQKYIKTGETPQDGQKEEITIPEKKEHSRPEPAKGKPEEIDKAQETGKKITELKEKTGKEKVEPESEETGTAAGTGERKEAVEYVKLKEKPPYIRAIEIKSKNPHKNEKGYWEATFFNETVMIYVPAGTFRMGLNAGEQDQRPGHNVYLDGFWMSKYEVTFEQYDRFCDETGEKKSKDRGWGRGKRPAIYVSWRSAQKYSEWLSQKTGLKFSLPTEAQWEKSARGPAGRLYPWGDSEPDKKEANYKGKKDGIKYTTAVGSFPAGASLYGILDMAGNVWEWCSDWYNPYYYNVSQIKNPEGPLRGTTRVVRGGSWKNGKRIIRPTHRANNNPSGRDPYTGFRVALKAPR